MSDKKLLKQLITAIKSGNKEEILFLLQKGADINGFYDKKSGFGSSKVTECFTPIRAAIQKGPEMVSFLIRQGANVNTFVDDTLQHIALFDVVSDNRPEYVKIAKILIDNGANVNAMNVYQDTPLIEACHHSGSTEIVNLLISNGANVNLANKEKETPLMLACRSGYKDIVRILLENGANVNVKSTDSSPSTPLIEACKNEAGMNNTKEIIKMLLDAGADVNFPSNNDGSSVVLDNLMRNLSWSGSNKKEIETFATMILRAGAIPSEMFKNNKISSKMLTKFLGKYNTIKKTSLNFFSSILFNP